MKGLGKMVHMRFDIGHRQSTGPLLGPTWQVHLVLSTIYHTFQIHCGPCQLQGSTHWLFHWGWHYHRWLQVGVFASHVILSVSSFFLLSCWGFRVPFGIADLFFIGLIIFVFFLLEVCFIHEHSQPDINCSIFNIRVNYLIPQLHPQTGRSGKDQPEVTVQTRVWLGEQKIKIFSWKNNWFGVWHCGCFGRW